MLNKRFFSIRKARELQGMLSKRILTYDGLPTRLRFVAGVDVSYAKKIAVAAIAVLDYHKLEPIEVVSDHIKERFPYIPTLLSFREAPVVFKALRRLKVKPEVYLVDGQGLAHPYRCGLASHLGVVAGIPTIGVAKSLLCGDVGSYNEEGWAPIHENGEVIGAAVVTKAGRKPLYVSVGHLVSLERAIEIVKWCTKDFRIPKPIRIAHDRANKDRAKLLGR